MTASALYVGAVVHERRRPVRHRLRYRAFWLLLDLDELPGLARRLRLFSLGGFNLFAFHPKDHALGEAGLRGRIDAHLADAGIEAGGTIRLLCMPRLLGYVFNPLSVYFCHRPDGALAAVIYEVSNTFGERHSYLLRAAPGADGVIRQGCAKAFYVSPFNDMAMDYAFRLRPPGARIDIAIDAGDAAGPILATALHGVRRDLDDRALLRVALSFPFLTLKVIAAIHWEALRLWIKGMRIKRRPTAPAYPVTIGAGSAAIPRQD